MPVTARLSRQFYDVFGEEIATELVDWFNAVDATYRGDLRELNELNFARFDANLNQRMAELRTNLAELKSELLRWIFAFWVTTGLAWAALFFRK